MFKFEQYKNNIIHDQNTFLEHIEIHGTQTQKNSVQYLKKILNVKFPESKNETAANTSTPVIGNNTNDIGTPSSNRKSEGGGNKKMSIKKTKKKRKNNKKSKTLPRRQFNKRKKNKEK